MHDVLDNTFSSLRKLNTLLLSPSVQWLPVLFRTMALLMAAPIIFLTALDIAAYLIARTVGATHYRSSHIVKVSETLPNKKATDKLQPSIVISGPSIEPHSLSSALSSLYHSNKTQLSDEDHQQLPTPPSESPSDTSSSSSSTAQTNPNVSPKYPMHFTSPSEGNFALAGEGMFSPPESRSNSPPLDRKSAYRTRKRSVSVGVEALGAITDSTASEADDTESTESSSAGEGQSGSVISLNAAAAPLRRRKPGLQFTPMKL